MNKSMLLLIAIVLFTLVFYIYYINNDTSNDEHYYNTVTQKESNPLTEDIMSESLNILLDPVFSNIIVFNNDTNPYAEGETIGLDKCLKQCNGDCVEFGITGIATCFPKST